MCEGHDDGDDTDSDGVPNGCDACPGGDDGQDEDGDAVPDGCDVCSQNTSQFNADFTIATLDDTGGPGDACCPGECPDRLENPNAANSRSWLSSVSTRTDMVCDELPPICP